MQVINLIRDSNSENKPNFKKGVVRFYKKSDRDIFIEVWGNGWITESKGINNS